MCGGYIDHNNNIKLFISMLIFESMIETPNEREMHDDEVAKTFV